MSLLRKVLLFNSIVHTLYQLMKDEEVSEIHDIFILYNAIHSNLSVLNHSTFYFEKKVFSDTDCD